MTTKSRWYLLVLESILNIYDSGIHGCLVSSSWTTQSGEPIPVQLLSCTHQPWLRACVSQACLLVYYLRTRFPEQESAVPFSSPISPASQSATHEQAISQHITSWRSMLISYSYTTSRLTKETLIGHV
eukprot:1852681-Pyramimonas_sp.AAC.2